MILQGSLTGHPSPCRPFYIGRNGKLGLTPPFCQPHRSTIVRADVGADAKLLEKPELRRPSRPPPPPESPPDQPANAHPLGAKAGFANGSNGRPSNGKASNGNLGDGKPRQARDRKPNRQRSEKADKPVSQGPAYQLQVEKGAAKSRNGAKDTSGSRSQPQMQQGQQQQVNGRQQQPTASGEGSVGTAGAAVASATATSLSEADERSLPQATAAPSASLPGLVGPPKLAGLSRPQRPAPVQVLNESTAEEKSQPEPEVVSPPKEPEANAKAAVADEELEPAIASAADAPDVTAEADSLAENVLADPEAPTTAQEEPAESDAEANAAPSQAKLEPEVIDEPIANSAPVAKSEEPPAQARSSPAESLNGSKKPPKRLELSRPQLITPPAARPAPPPTNAAMARPAEPRRAAEAPPQLENKASSVLEAAEPEVTEPEAAEPEVIEPEAVEPELAAGSAPLDNAQAVSEPAAAVKLDQPAEDEAVKKELAAAAEPSSTDDVPAGEAVAEAASSLPLQEDGASAQAAKPEPTKFVDGAVGTAPALRSAPRRPAPPPQRAAAPAPVPSGNRTGGSSSGPERQGFRDQGRRQPSFVRGSEDRSRQGAYNSSWGRQSRDGEDVQALRSTDEDEELGEPSAAMPPLTTGPQRPKAPDSVQQSSEAQSSQAAQAVLPELAGRPELVARPVLGARPKPPPTQQMINRASEALLRERVGYENASRPRQDGFRQDGPRQAGPPQGRQQFQRPPPQQTPSSPADAEVSQAGARDSKPRRKERTKQDVEQHRESRYERKQRRIEQRKATMREQEEIFEVGGEGMMVGELADRLAINPGDVVKALFLKGIMANVNQVLDKEMVRIVAEEYGVEVLDIEDEGVDAMARKTVDFIDEDDIDFLVPRPPVVTVMGHVDHGKTSLLDYIRKTKVAAGEAGGITQAIGAYTGEVTTSEGEVKQITFLDTPGHEAFSAMRARGAKVTDVVIIVVASDDGVRPQTLEAISHAKAAKVPIVVAINKIDKEGANIERAKQEMSEAGLLPEEWGGDTPMVPISAKKGMGVDNLLETVLLVAEIEQLTANPQKAARGTVVEAHLDKRTGPVATLLVATGTLKQGDVVHAGATYGRVRTMSDSRMLPVEEGGPSIAVQMVGLNNVPTAGDEFTVCASEPEARKFATAIEESIRLSRLAEQAGSSMVTSHTFATMDEDGDGLQYLNIILKADASGACEAVKAALNSLPQDRVSLRFLLAAAAEITTSDVQLAYASEGRIIGFNLEISEAVQAAAKQYGVIIQSYKVIYELVDEIRALMEGRLGSVEERVPLGQAAVRAVFGTGSRRVAGCMVTEGSLRKGALAVVTRGKKQVAEGTLNSLRRVKEVVTEVSNGLECGVGVDGFNDWREGDKIEVFEVKVKTQSLEEASESRAANSLAFFADGDDEDDEE